MSASSVLVVPATVPRATVTPVATTPHRKPVVMPVQPLSVPAPHVLAVRMAQADAETVGRLQAEVDRLRARLSA